jgi:hypothetical protein
MAAKRNVLAYDSLEHFAEIHHNLVKIDGLRVHHLLPAERQQLPGQIRRPIRSLADLIQAPGHLAGHPDGVHAPQIRVAANDREKIIKVMGNPARKLPYGLKLLGLPEILLGFPQRRFSSDAVQGAAAMVGQRLQRA